MNVPHLNDDRLTAIESLLTHMQHDVDQLNKALAGQQADLTALRRDFQLIRDRLASPPDDLPPALEERPPHY